ncbi:MAG TPA: ABC transporter permease [Hydrogenophaga sp.]|uniref:ABC transporter permease n=1 Tax=Hydrogenophaga sp. TaxID=1904254 RepID=UPI0008CB3DE6|nr:ABC transporter permease subunit [Hydrogenophaga sp.]OGA79705.1 MAG: ABC transporter permease [Burkholderiales bacterium GWE1_65_30]OGA92638.1 MAG: ABC transporter permease [Burkholderiales bacterium GWF1_66_17]HAX22004.1 ABC transporter permease [Hydrogenophaga sp.]HBU21170.1 ABC transporter permease [Hydrogenophaga sp.]
MNISPGAWLSPAVDWLNTHWHPLFAFISKVVEASLDQIEGLLLGVPYYAVIGALALAAGLLLSVRMGALVVATLGFCVLNNQWDATMQTLALMLVAVVTAVLIAFPLGVLASRSKTLEAVFRPVLDIMQTVPPWVYLIPAVIFFSLGRVPALMATMVYGIPPMLRLTTLAFKQVPKEMQELGQALGAKPMTILFRIELPAAMPTLVVGLNQCILMCLAMVVLAGLVGAGGLGAEVTRGLTRMEMGLGLRAGLSIVAIALLLDRLSRAAFQGQRKGSAR